MYRLADGRCRILFSSNRNFIFRSEIRYRNPKKTQAGEGRKDDRYKSRLIHTVVVDNRTQDEISAPEYGLRNLWDCLSIVTESEAIPLRQIRLPSIDIQLYRTKLHNFQVVAPL